MQRKVLSIVLTLLFVLSSLFYQNFTINVRANDPATSGDFGTNNSFHWDFTNGVLTITGSGEMMDFECPSMSVTVPWGDFKSNITSVVIGSGITSIGAYAFYNYNDCQITSITLPTGLEKIGERAFMRTCISSIAIPNTVIEIGSMAFRECENLSTVILPNSVTTLGSSCFSGCDNLVSVSLSNSITSISASAFKDCESLKNITIPEGIITIEEKAFYGCRALETISFPSTLTTIGDMAFADQDNSMSLTTISWGGVKNIGQMVFFNCPLTSLVLPNGLETIGYAAFAVLPFLTSVTIPSSVISIGEYAFTDCYSLTSVKFWGTVGVNGSGIGSNAFSNTNLDLYTGNPNTQLIALTLPTNWTDNYPAAEDGAWYGGYFTYSLSGGTENNGNSSIATNSTGSNSDGTKAATSSDNSSDSTKTATEKSTQQTTTSKATTTTSKDEENDEETSNSKKQTTTKVESYTVPVKGENTVEVVSEIVDGNAKIDNISEKALEKILGTNDTSSNASKEITIDVSSADSEVKSAELTKETIALLSETLNAENKVVDTLVIKLTNATVEISAETMKTISEEAQGDSILLVVNQDRAVAELNDAQKTALSDMEVVSNFDAYFESNGSRIHDFKGGTAKVSIAFSLDSTKDARFYHIYYVADNGTMERQATAVEDGYISFVATHFSDYVVIYDENDSNENDMLTEEENEDETLDKAVNYEETADISEEVAASEGKLAWPWIILILAVICLTAICIVFVKKKK